MYCVHVWAVHTCSVFMCIGLCGAVCTCVHVSMCNVCCVCYCVFMCDGCMCVGYAMCSVFMCAMCACVHVCVLCVYGSCRKCVCHHQ